uniref:DUF4629 domain-containing protein n=1 Tax=Sciurus vulgaris TaxID=55149 RepID=A0A8D2DQP5_SCIVU
MPFLKILKNLNAASLTGSACNFSRVSASAVSSAWLLPSNLGTSFQPLMGSAYLYQHSSTTMLSGVTSQQQIPMAPASYPSIFEWDTMGGAEKKSSSLGDYTLTVTDQDTAAPSMSMTAQYDTTSDANVRVHEYPSLLARLVQVAPCQIPNQAHTLSLPYQAESQVFYYDQNTLGPLLSGDLGPYLQSYGSVSYARNRVAAPQPEMVMVLKEVQSTNILPLASTPGTYYCVSTQPITETNFQGMEAAVGLQPPSQTFCLQQPPEFPNCCSSRSIQNLQMLESNPPTEPGDISVITPDQSSTTFVELPPTQCQKETDSLDEVKAMLSNPLDAYLFAVENQDPLLLPLEISDSHELLMPHSEHNNLGKSSLSLEDQGTLENGIECSSDFADLTALVGDIHLPEIFNFFKDLDQPGSPQIIKNKHKASEPPDGTPEAKMQPKAPECTLEGEVACRDADSHRALGNRAKPFNRNTQKAAPSRNSKAKGPGQEKPKRSRENSFKRAEDSKQAGNKVKTEEKPMIPKAKRKRNQPELSQETFKKPRSYLGMHMLESVQVFHALGKKNDKNPGLSSSRALGNSSSNKDPRPCPARKPWLQVKGPEKTQVRAQKPDISAAKECPSPSQHELPPPGKVKLVPLPFLSSEKPQPRPVYRRPQSLASRRPTVAYPAQPASTSSAQPRAVNQFRPAPANTSLMHPAKPAQPAVSHSIHSGFTTSTQPSVPQSAASRPAAYRASSCTSVQRGPVSTLVNKLQSQLPKPQHRYLLQDFALQPIPWRKPNVPEPVMSTPITKEQRPEREAMKKKAQQQRENAAKYPLGKVQFFIEREREMEIAHYYGYTI